MQKAVVAISVTAFALALLVLAAITAVTYMPHQVASVDRHDQHYQQVYPRPTTYQPYGQSTLGFRDLELWRKCYKLHSTTTAAQFCQYGDYRTRSGNTYRRLKNYSRYQPYMSELYGSRHGGGRVEPPLDANLLHVTLVYLDKKTDPASQHLANCFMAEGHWLDHLRRNSHFRTASYGDPLWHSWIRDKFGLSREDLPAIIVTEGIQKRVDEPQYRQSGRLVYYAPAWSMPWNPDKLAHEIWTQIQKGPAVASRVNSISFNGQSRIGQGVLYHPEQYDQCEPDDPDCPRPNYPGERRRGLLPLRPQVGVDIGINPTVIFCVGAVVLAFVFLGGAIIFAAVRRRRGP